MSVTTSDPAPRVGTLRRDAERNRRLILDAARSVMAELGINAGFNEVARRAGVGVGTVYRHFPDRQGLIQALVTERLDEVLALADHAVARDDPSSAVTWFMERLIELQTADLGLRQVLANWPTGHEHLTAVRDRLATAIGAVLHRAQATGRVRRDLEVQDLVALGTMISSTNSSLTPDVRRRCLAVVLDGLPDARTTTSRSTASARAERPAPRRATPGRGAHRARR